MIRTLWKFTILSFKPTYILYTEITATIFYERFMLKIKFLEWKKAKYNGFTTEKS